MTIVWLFNTGTSIKHPENCLFHVQLMEHRARFVSEGWHLLAYNMQPKSLDKYCNLFRTVSQKNQEVHCFKKCDLLAIEHTGGGEKLCAYTAEPNVPR